MNQMIALLCSGALLIGSAGILEGFRPTIREGVELFERTVAEQTPQPQKNGFEYPPLLFWAKPVDQEVIDHLAGLDDEVILQQSGYQNKYRFDLGDYVIRYPLWDPVTNIILEKQDGSDSTVIFASSKKIDRMYLIDRYSIGIQYTPHGQYDGYAIPPSYVCVLDIRTGEGVELPSIQIESKDSWYYTSNYIWHHQGQYYTGERALYSEKLDQDMYVIDLHHGNSPEEAELLIAEALYVQWIGDSIYYISESDEGLCRLSTDSHEINMVWKAESVSDLYEFQYAIIPGKAMVYATVDRETRDRFLSFVDLNTGQEWAVSGAEFTSPNQFGITSILAADDGNGFYFSSSQGIFAVDRKGIATKIYDGETGIRYFVTDDTQGIYAREYRTADDGVNYTVYNLYSKDGTSVTELYNNLDVARAAWAAWEKGMY